MIPAWARDWRVIVGGAAMLGGVGALLVGGSRGWFVASPSAPLPSGAPAPDLGGPRQMVRPMLRVVPGLTYFAVLETHGTVTAAASSSRVKAAAEGEGFRDVVVFQARPELFPGRELGDFYVRGTFRGAAPRELARKTSVFLGSLVVRDAWESV